MNPPILLIYSLASHSLRGSVDWNYIAKFRKTWFGLCHSLRGSVDWNHNSPKMESSPHLVTPFAGVWIEILSLALFISNTGSHSLRGSVDWNYTSLNIRLCNWNVTPFAGVWIEINSFTIMNLFRYKIVTPFAGVWIEMSILIPVALDISVTPFAGVWIEIVIPVSTNDLLGLSLPSRECGLKYYLK